RNPLRVVAVGSTGDADKPSPILTLPRFGRVSHLHHCRLASGLSLLRLMAAIGARLTLSVEAELLRLVPDIVDAARRLPCAVVERRAATKRQLEGLNFLSGPVSCHASVLLARGTLCRTKCCLPVITICTRHDLHEIEVQPKSGGSPRRIRGGLQEQLTR